MRDARSVGLTYLLTNRAQIYLEMNIIMNSMIAFNNSAQYMYLHSSPVHARVIVATVHFNDNDECMLELALVGYEGTSKYAGRMSPDG